MLSAQMLGDRSKESIPPIIAYGRRLNLHQNRLDLRTLPSAFLEKTLLAATALGLSSDAGGSRQERQKAA